MFREWRTTVCSRYVQNEKSIIWIYWETKRSRESWKCQPSTEFSQVTQLSLECIKTETNLRMSRSLFNAKLLLTKKRSNMIMTIWYIECQCLQATTSWMLQLWWLNLQLIQTLIWICFLNVAKKTMIAFMHVAMRRWIFLKIFKWQP